VPTPAHALPYFLPDEETLAPEPLHALQRRKLRAS
jgi:hypothetical protein